MSDLQIHQSGHDHQNRGPASFGFVVAFTAIAAIAVSLRLYVRLWIVRSPGWDDVAIVISVILAIASATCYGLAVSYGYGRHIRSIPPAHIIAMIKWNVVGVATFYLDLLFSKVSVSLLLLRILGRAGNRYTSAFLWSMVALAGIIAVMATGAMLGEYAPVWKEWDDQEKVAGYGKMSVKIGIVQGGECLPSSFQPTTFEGYAKAFAESVRGVNTVIGAIIDFALAIFPLTFLLRSSMPRKRKIIICGLMSCGVLAGVSSIARVVLSALLVNFSDFTYDAVVGWYLAVVEEVICIVVACVPCLTPLANLVGAKRGYRRESMGREMLT